MRSPPLIPADELVRAYCEGWFPMASAKDGPVDWYTADPRGVLDFADFHVPRRLRATLRSGRFEVRVNTAFGEVIRACAERDDTWISPVIVASYENLHALGLAHSVETWQEGALVGGLYGVAIRGAFFGESMFHRVSDAAKVALVHLVERLEQRGYVLLDTQMVTPLMTQFGATTIPLTDYLERLAHALQQQCTFVDEVEKN